MQTVKLRFTVGLDLLRFSEWIQLIDPWLHWILGHLSDTDICPTTEISFSDKRPCRTRIRKRTFVRKSVTIIFKIMLETMVCNVWVTGCSTVRSVSWFNTVDKQLTSPVPVHTNHDVEQASSTVYQQKEELKRKAVETDLPTKRHAADAVSGISFEARGKINYHMSSLARSTSVSWWLRPLSQQQVHYSVGLWIP